MNSIASCQHSELEKDILSSDLVAVFRRLSTSWGDQMNSVFANAILAILESKQGGTLVDLRRFLVEKTFRDTYLKSVLDPNIVYYWQKEYPLLKSNSIGSILTRLDTFLRPKLIRNMVAQKKGLDFENILDTGKILLVKLSQGLIGTENSYLLGTFFVTKMYQAAMARQIKSKEDRNNFFLYIDEFQNFITPSMSSILSGARKYHLGLILAHQDMTQLNKYDTELASAIVSNAGTRVCFRLGDTDAKRFAQGFTFFEAQDLENLHTGQAVARIERPDFDFNLNTIHLQFPDEATAKQRLQQVLEVSRKQYGTPKEEVEAQLQSLLEPSVWEQEPIKRPEPKQKQEPAPELPKDEPVIAPKQELAPLSDEAIAATKERFVRQREDSQHRYLQNLIKKMAESRGYKATIEEPTPDGKGRIDVALERNSQRIAVEVCMTTETDWEMHNIEKCLMAGYELVVECSSDKKTLENISKKIQSTFNESQRSKILVLEPEQLFEYLDKQVAQSSNTEVRMKGYRVKVEYNPSSIESAEQKMNAINKTVNEARRSKKK
ncbi:MAG: TraM recognition domain-containing protein [Bacteroidota bacterium]